MSVYVLFPVASAGVGLAPCILSLSLACLLAASEGDTREYTPPPPHAVRAAVSLVF